MTTNDPTAVESPPREPFEAVYERMLRLAEGSLPTERARQEFRATLWLRYHHPGEHVAYIDTWEGDALRREVVARAGSEAALEDLVTRLPQGRSRVTLKRFEPIITMRVTSTYDIRLRAKRAFDEAMRRVREGGGRDE